VAVDWLKVIFNPSLPTRLAHMVTAAYLTTALTVLGAAAFQALRGRDGDESRVMRRMAIGLIAVLAPLQLVLGDLSGKVALARQPTKVAAIEGWWESGRQPSILIGLPDDRSETTKVLLQTPKGIGSWVVAGDAQANLKGLKAWPRTERPPTVIPFWTFRIMVGLGLLMIAVGWWGAWLWLRGKLDRSRAFQTLAFLAGPSGFLAVLAGWMVTEVGRQPYVVFGALRTADAVSPVPAASVGISLLVFMATYAVVFTAGAVYIGRLLVQGPGPKEGAPEAPEAPGNPLGMASDTAPGARTLAAE
jgi:cytochrome d ubiquinol oxidase subunit I